MNEKKFHVGIKALVQNDKNEILVLKINPKELTNNKHGVYWDLPGGRIKEGDSVEQTLQKELEEEIGYIGHIKNVNLFHGSIASIEIPVGEEKFGLVLFVYSCKIKMGKIKLSEEHTDYKWASLKDAKKLLAVKFSKDFIERLDSL
ncbi:MAG: NUDIX domain-containing protein [Candidatus Aenigmatarchaeota archaeon]